MTEKTQTHMIAIEALNFITERRSRRLSLNTIDYYSREIGYFTTWLAQRGAESMEDLTPDLLRLYLEDLGTHRNAGGIHASWRAMKAFCRWFELEVEDLAPWRNPMRKVAAPKISTDPLPGVALDDFSRLCDACDTSPLGQRDRAIMMTLLDTGARAMELLTLNLEDVNMQTGEVYIRAGKGNKRRTTFIGAKTRRVLTRYLRTRRDAKPTDPLFVVKSGNRMGHEGLRAVVISRARRAGIQPPSPHDFRRAFALTSLKNGMDIFTLQRIMGHSSLNILRRYLDQRDEDLRDNFARTGPVDNLR